MEGLFYIGLIMCAGWVTISTAVKFLSLAKDCWRDSNYVAWLVCIAMVPVTPLLFFLIILLGGLTVEMWYILLTGQL